MRYGPPPLYQRRNREVAERTRQRQEREEEAPRLSEEVPSLRSLRLTMRFLRGAQAVPESQHVRIVVVPRAPALFVVPCSDPLCREGGHDVTREIMVHLRASRGTFGGEASCNGSLGSAAAPCVRLMSFAADATYA